MRIKCLAVHCSLLPPRFLCRCYMGHGSHAPTFSVQLHIWHARSQGGDPCKTISYFGWCVISRVRYLSGSTHGWVTTHRCWSSTCTRTRILPQTRKTQCRHRVPTLLWLDHILAFLLHSAVRSRLVCQSQLPRPNWFLPLTVFPGSGFHLSICGNAFFSEHLFSACFRTTTPAVRYVVPAVIPACPTLTGRIACPVPG